MLGYVRAFKPEMKIKDFELYKGIYCSLCRSLGRLYSPVAQLFLSYDFALAAVLRLAVAESGCTFSQKRCPYNPAKKCMICSNRENIDFCAHALIIMVYYKVIDNLHDGGLKNKIISVLIYPLVALMHKKAKKLAPEIENTVCEMMKQQAKTEKNNYVCLDEAAHGSADALGKIFVQGFDSAEKETLYSFGYMIGRFVYILDAADDLESDIRTNSFNPFKGEDITTEAKRTEFADKITAMLNLTQSQALEILDTLDINRFYDILDNIVFEGLTACAKKTLAKYRPPEKEKKTYTVN